MKLPFNAHTTNWDADNALALACASNIAYTLDPTAAAISVQDTFGFGNFRPFNLIDTQGCAIILLLKSLGSQWRKAICIAEPITESIRDRSPSAHATFPRLPQKLIQKNLPLSDDSVAKLRIDANGAELAQKPFHKKVK